MPEKFSLNFVLVSSANIQKLKLLRYVKATNGHVKNYTLCRQCANFLCKGGLGVLDQELNKRKKWQNTWAAFFRDLLFGAQKTNNVKFYDVYSGPYLWKFVPKEARMYWIHAIRDVFHIDGSRVYKGCTVDEPAPYFVDQTSTIDDFWGDIKSYSLKRWLKALSFDKLVMGNPERKEPIVVPNVLCPWDCSEFCFCAEKMNLGIII